MTSMFEQGLHYSSRCEKSFITHYRAPVLVHKVFQLLCALQDIFDCLWMKEGVLEKDALDV
jgi:hypothetical protein